MLAAVAKPGVASLPLSLSHNLTRPNVLYAASATMRPKVLHAASSTNFCCSSIKSADVAGTNKRAIFLRQQQQEIEQEIEQANNRHAGRIAVRKWSAQSDEQGGDWRWGVYAVKDFEAGTLLFTGYALQGAFQRQQGTHTIQTALNTHVTMDLPARFTNHACGGLANMGVRLPQAHSSEIGGVNAVYDFVARESIAAGDELCWDYETTEYCLTAPFRCSCGAQRCRGFLQGFRFHCHQILAEHGPEWVAPYLLQTPEGKRVH